MTKFAREYEAILQTELGALLSQHNAKVLKLELSDPAILNFGKAKDEFDELIKSQNTKKDKEISKLMSKERRKRKRENEEIE